MYLEKERGVCGIRVGGGHIRGEGGTVMCRIPGHAEQRSP